MGEDKAGKKKITTREVEVKKKAQKITNALAKKIISS